MDDNRFHFWLPLQNISLQSITPHGGGKSYKRENIGEHSKRLKEIIDISLEEIENKRDSDILETYFFQVESPTEFSIKDSSANLEKIKIDLVSKSVEKNYQAIGRISKKDIGNLKVKVDKYANEKGNPGKSYFAALENFKSISLLEKVKIDRFEKNHVYKCLINFFNILLRSEKEKVSERVLNLLEEWNINDFRRIVLVDGSFLISATLNYEQIRLIGEDFISVSTITFDSAAIISESYQSVALPQDLKVQSCSSQELVCIIDSGISTSGSVMNNLVQESHTHLPQNSVTAELSHGTLVGSRILFGDDIERQIAENKLSPICKLIDVQIFGKDANNNTVYPNESDILVLLNDLVPKLSDRVKIFNLSFGFINDYNLVPVTKLAQLLDSLSNIYKVTFVVSSGNIKKFGVYPDYFNHRESRMTPPAESMNAITVGSIAMSSDSNCISRVNEISPFSSIGPGFNDGIKPELVEHGGNMLKSFAPTPRHAAFGLHKDGGSLAFDIGTSFAAPIICNSLVKILEFYGKQSPNLLKALLIHFCDEVLTPSISIHPLFLRGFGKPNLDSVFFAKQNNYAIFHSGTIKINQYQWIKFHIPNCLAEDKDCELEVSITLVYNPPVNPDDLKEYSQSRVNCHLYKNKNGDLIQIQSFNDDEKVSTSWNNIIRFRKSFKRSYSSGEWSLRLRLFTRNVKDDDFLQDYSLIVEVLDKTGKTNVYDSFIHEFKEEYRIKIKDTAA